MSSKCKPCNDYTKQSVSENNFYNLRGNYGLNKNVFIERAG